MRNIDLELVHKSVNDVIERTLEEKRIVGTVVQIALGGNLIYSRPAGWADREQKRPMQENALFRYASVTKPIVSTAALVLISQGRLHLNDLVEKWLPTFRPKLPNGQYAPMTVHHLMTHTAGLTYRFFQEKRELMSLPGYRTAWILRALH